MALPNGTSTSVIAREIATPAITAPQLIYGSVALDDYKHGWSDIDILVLTEEELSLQQAEELVELRETLTTRFPDNVYFRKFEGGILSLEAFLDNKREQVVYWGTSGQRITDKYAFDSFCMMELLENGVLLYGEDIRSLFMIPTYTQLYEDIIRHYQLIRKYAETTRRHLYSYGWLFDIARGIYTLRTGKVIAKTAAGEWALEAGICPVPDALSKALEVRKAPMDFQNKSEAMDYAEQLGTKIQLFADVLEKELIFMKPHMDSRKML